MSGLFEFKAKYLILGLLLSREIKNWRDAILTMLATKANLWDRVVPTRYVYQVNWLRIGD
jgi:hypothetical protein